MRTRLLIFFLFSALPLWGDAEQDITAMVSDLAGALSANNPERFLKALDHNMAGYRQIEQDLNALASNAYIGCSIELLSNSGTASVQTAELDWYMSLKSQQDENLIERRRTKVTLKMEKRGKKWVVTSLTPISLFAPMTVR